MSEELSDKEKWSNFWKGKPWCNLSSEDYEFIFKHLWVKMLNPRDWDFFLIPGIRAIAKRREFICKYGEKAWEDSEKEHIDSMSEEEKKFWGYI